MPRIITAAFTSAVPKNAPGEIVYIPVGSSKINATVSGKPGEITVNVPTEKGAAIAATLQAALAKRLSSPVRPRLAFDHQRTGPASGHPTSFSFDPARGIILSAGWSNSGRAAIEGGDYGYFSPTFLIDEDGTPSGLPDKGEIGSLVDEPAFRSIGLIAAADADLTETKPSNTMSKLIFAALAISAAAENAETEAVNAISALKVEATDAKQKLVILEAANAEMKAKVEAAEASVKVANDKRLDSKVEAVFAAGKAAPKDEVTRKALRELVEASEVIFDNHVATLPAKFASLDKSIVTAADGKVVQASDFEGKAKALVTAGQAKTIDEAFGLVAAADPSSYSDYLTTLKG